METLTLIVGLLFTIPCIIVESTIKLIIAILCIPIAIIAASCYPIIKIKGWKTYEQIKDLWKYATKIKHGFCSAKLLSLWDCRTKNEDLDW